MLTKLIGQTLDGKYYLDKLLGQGGMGAVFLATHLGTKRPVALKVIAPQFTSNEEVGERFRREAEAAGRLRHPNVVNVTDFGVTVSGKDQFAYLVMEYLDGRSLGDTLKEQGQLPLNFVVDIVEQICLAIGNAHKLGIIHRDLKPDNIWLQPDGRGSYIVKVLDFGLAKLRDASGNDDEDHLSQIGGTGLPTQVVINSPQTIRAGHTTQAQLAGDEEAATQIQLVATEPEAATMIQPSTTEIEAATQILPLKAREIEAATMIQPAVNAPEIEAATMIQMPASAQEEKTHIFDIADEAATQIQPANSSYRNEAATQIQPAPANPPDEGATLIQPLEGATQIQLASVTHANDDADATRIQPAPAVTGSNSVSQQKSAAGISLQRNSQTAAVRSSGGLTSGFDSASTVELTRFGSILGTPLYMSPEQCRGEALDARSDIYSLGIIVYQMLAGQLPFTGSMMELIAKHSDEPPPQLKEKRPDIPKALTSLVMSTLAKNPEARPPTAETFAAALRATAEDEGEILKQAKALYYASQKSFFVLSMSVYGPMAALSIGASMLFNSRLSQSLALSGVYYLALLLLMFLGTRVIISLFTFLVDELRLMPTAKIETKEVWKKIVKRLPVLLRTSLLNLLSVILNGVKLLVPGANKYIAHALTPSIVAMEEQPTVAQALKRSALLVQQLRPLARSLAARDFGIMLTAILAFPFIMSVMAMIFDGTRLYTLSLLKVTMIRNFVGGYSWFILLVMHTIYAAVPLALLYFKARQANGEEIDKLASRDWQGETQKRMDKMGRATLVWFIVPLLMLGFMSVSSILSLRQGSGDSIMQPVREGRTITVKRLLDKGADINEVRFGNTSALMYAAQDGHTEVVKLLIKEGAKVDARDNDGDDALMYAAFRGRTEIAKILLANGANINIENKEKITPLIGAALKGQTETVKALLAANPDVTVRDSSGKTALMYAETEGYTEIIEMLKAAGANQ
jgi:serine/threonine protein kinase